MSLGGYRVFSVCRYANISWRRSSQASTVGSGSVPTETHAYIDMRCLQVSCGFALISRVSATKLNY